MIILLQLNRIERRTSNPHPLLLQIVEITVYQCFASFLLSLVIAKNST